jgi:hypothetical protein
MERHSKHPHTPSGWRRIILFPFFPLSSVLSKRALIFLGFLGHHTPGTASRYPSWASRRLGPVAESFAICILQHREAGGRYRWFSCVLCGQEETQQCTTPPNARQRSETVCLFLDIFLGYTPGGIRRAGGWTLFSFLGWFGCGKIPPSSLGWYGWLACMGCDGPRPGLGSFCFPFLVSWMHGYGSNDGYTPTFTPNHQPRPPPPRPLLPP